MRDNERRDMANADTSETKIGNINVSVITYMFWAFMSFEIMLGLISTSFQSTSIPIIWEIWWWDGMSLWLWNKNRKYKRISYHLYILSFMSFEIMLGLISTSFQSTSIPIIWEIWWWDGMSLWWLPLSISYHLYVLSFMSFEIMLGLISTSFQSTSIPII